MFSIAFLKNSDEYSPEEQYKCLKLLAIIKMKEAIPIILSYIKCYKDPASIPIYQFAIDLLWQYSDSELEDYNVKGYLVDNMLSYVKEDKLITCETMLYILNNCYLSNKNIKVLKKVKSMIILGQNLKIQKAGKANFGQYFEECETVRVIGDTKNLSFLKQFMHIKRLEVESNTHLVILTYELKELKNLISVKTLHIQTNQPEIRYINRMTENMKNLESIEIHLENDDLFLETNTFDDFPQLKEVSFTVNESLAKAIEKNLTQIRGKNKDLKISIL